MIQISDKAKSRVAQVMKSEGKGADYFVRVSVLQGGCSGLSYDLTFDNAITEKDQVFEDNGMKLVTNIQSILYLAGTTLDFSDGLNGKGFYFENPNATRTCSCGESFAV